MHMFRSRCATADRRALGDYCACGPPSAVKHSLRSLLAQDSRVFLGVNNLFPHTNSSALLDTARQNQLFLCLMSKSEEDVGREVMLGGRGCFSCWNLKCGSTASLLLLSLFISLQLFGNRFLVY